MRVVLPSLTKANNGIRALIAEDLVKLQNYRRSSNKVAHLYQLTRAGVAAKIALTRRFLARRVREYDALRLGIEGLRRESSLEVEAASAPHRELVEQ